MFNMGPVTGHCGSVGIKKMKRICRRILFIVTYMFQYGDREMEDEETIRDLTQRLSEVRQMAEVFSHCSDSNNAVPLATILYATGSDRIRAFKVGGKSEMRH